MTEQQQWNRYVDAINYCIRLGYNILPIMSNKSSNVRHLFVKNEQGKETIITLKRKKYKCSELYNLIKERL